jgi:hypothetical protein
MRFGDWIVQVGPEASEAGTSNEAGEGFGFVCSVDCLHYVDLGPDCAAGDVVNAKATILEKEFDLVLTCEISEDFNVFIADVNLEYLATLPRGEQISLSFTSKSGTEFRTEFSLRGCAEAITLAAQAAPSTLAPAAGA